MEKVLFIDIWEKGYRNFTRINNEFLTNGYSTLLVHTGSFYSKNIETEKQLDSLIVRDIRFYRTHIIKKVLEIEKPDIVLMLNLSFIFDRAIVNCCKKLGIKVVYLAHGKLVDADFAKDEAEKLNTTIYNNLGRIFRKKNFLVFWNYLTSLTGLSLFVNPVKLIVDVFRRPSNFLTFATYSNELDANLLLVFTEKEKELLSQTFNFPSDKIKVVGNPEITTFMKTPQIPREKFLKSIGLPANSAYLVYLDDGFVSDKIITREEWLESLSELVKATDAMELTMIVKLHPKTINADYESFFKEKNIRSIGDCDFKNLLSHATAVISHLSTTILYALLFEKKVLIPYWGVFANLCKSYPENVVHYCTSIPELKSTIQGDHTNKALEIRNYLKDNGINLETDSIKNIVREISQIQ